MLKGKGFSLLELVIVVVILGVIAAIAIPRMSRGAEGASDSSLTQNLSALRGAIDLYTVEHGGAFPTVANIADQLTKYSNLDGTVISGTRTAACLYGPYLRAVPPLSLGNNKGSTVIDHNPANGVGWVYDEGTGVIFGNTGGLKDASGKMYTDY